MVTYTIYQPAISSRDPIERADELVFVKDGFCWPALFFSVFWLVYHRLWLVLGLTIVIVFIIFVFLNMFSTDLAEVTLFAAILLFAGEANAIRRMMLEKSGYNIKAVITGKSLFDCERKYFALLHSHWHSAPLDDENIPGTIATAGLGQIS